MPGVSYGPAVSTSSGATLTLLYDRIDNDANNAWLVNPRVEFYSRSGWSDSLNTMTSGGTAINGAQFHSGLINGGTRSWNVSAKAVPLTYGSETSVTFSVTVANLSFYSGDSSSVTRTWTIAFPARPYSKPNPATSFTNTYVNDNRVNLSWVSNYTGANGATPWMNQAIERTETGEWADATQVGWLGWEPTSWSDTGVVPNRRYHYRHKAVNPAGDSPYAYASNAIYTTPAAPSYPYAQKTSGGSILVTWDNEAPWANSFEVSDSANGTTWTVSGTSSVSEYAHSDPNQSVTHRYRVRAKTPDGKWSAYSPVSNIIQLQAPPNAPTWGSVDPAYNGAATITTPWTHNPVDTTPQTAYEVQHRTSSNNGATWMAWATTGKLTSTSSTRTWAAGTWEQNRLVQLQVRTWGAHATASPWSSSAQFRTSAPPTTAVTAPAGTTVSSKRVAVSWNYADAEGIAQSSARVELLRGAASLGLWELSGAGASYTPPVDLGDATSYTVRVSVRDGHGLWSSPASKTFTTEFVPPPAPVVNVEWDEEHGAATVAISNPAPVSPQPAAVSNDVYRDGVLIAEGLPVDATFTDPLPLPAGSSYRVEAVSALPSTSETTVELAPVEAVFRRFWINSGSGWRNVASCWGNVKRGHSQGRNRVTEQYSGRELPVETIGEGRTSKFTLSGTLLLHEDSPNDFFNVVNDPSPVHYRDRYGSWRVSPSVVDSDADNDAVAQITVTLTEVDSGGLL